LRWFGDHLHGVVQVDGGEWTMYLFLYYAMLLQRKQAKQMIGSKLPVSHGHSDQDSRFGKISHWLFGFGGKKKTPGHDCLTPSHFEALIFKCFEQVQHKVHVQRWWCVHAPCMPDPPVNQQLFAFAGLCLGGRISLSHICQQTSKASSQKLQGQAPPYMRRRMHKTIVHTKYACT
jgi:hypothetical protein